MKDTNMRRLALSIVLFLWFIHSNLFAQTNTTASGNWSTPANWSSGVPAGGSTANVNHAMTINVNISVSSGTYTINKPIVDVAGGSAYTLNVSGNFDVNATSVFEGACTVNGGGTLTVRSGDTLTVGATTFANNSAVVVEAGGVLIVNGNLQNSNNSSGIQVDGTIIVNGNFSGGNHSVVYGVGTISTTGSLITSGGQPGTVFGSTGNCSTGPCSSSITTTNTIASAQTLCGSGTPSGLTGTACSGYTYQWQISTTSATTGFTNISSATNQNYAPGSLSVTTWYRRNVSISGNTASSAAVRILVIASGSWVGGTSSNWSTPANWCGGALPTASTNVVITSGTTFSPSVSGSVSVKNLTVNPSATLTNTSTGVINIYGNFNNAGTFVDNGIYTSTGVVNFVGSSAQTITGATAFRNLTLNNTTGLTLNSAVTVNGILKLTAGVLTTNGNLSQDLYNGAIAGTGSGSTSGNVRFFKYIYGDKYHYLSTPISGLTAADWNDNVTIKFGVNSNLYAYNEAIADTNSSVGWTAFTATSQNLVSMKGYSLYFPRFIYLTLLDVSGTYTHGANFSNTGLTNTSSGKSTSDGLQFVGNPYPSTIDWGASSGWTKTGLDNAIYTYDSRTSRYVSYVNNIGTNGGSRYIGAMQGFFVKVSNPGTGTLAMTNDVRITSTLIDVWRTESEDQILRISAASGDYNDETVIRFTDDATDNFDSEFDAYKLINGDNSPSLFSTSINPSTNYSINSLPTLEGGKTIPLTLTTSFAGNYSFTADLSGFNDQESIWIEDKTLGIQQNLKLNNTYTVSLGKGTFNNRFFVQYQKREATVTSTTSNQYNDHSIEIATYQQNLSILFPTGNIGKADIAIFDTLGKNVWNLSGADISSGKIEATLPLQTGIYIVKVNATSSSAVQQVYLVK